MKKLLLGLILPIVVTAQAAMAVERLELGLGVAAAPDYEGSEDYVPVPLPYARVDLDSGQFLYLQGNHLRGLDVKTNVLPDDIYRVGPLLQYIPERDDVDNNKVDRMKDVDTSVMFGLFAGFEIERWTAEIEARQDVAGGNGFLLTLNAGYNMPLSAGWNLSFIVSTTYADGDYMNSYFSVDGGDSRRSGLDKFNADSGFRDVGLELMAHYNFYGNWNAMALARYTRLIGDAADSPIVDDEGSANQFFGGILFIYSF